MNPDFAKIAQACIEHAGLSGKITIIAGSFAERFKELKSTFGIRTVDVIYSRHNLISLQLFFIDHWKDQYLPDIKLIESSGLLRKGSVVIADNAIYPGCPDYLKYIRANKNFTSRLVESSLEYSDRKDGMEVSVFDPK